MKKKEILAKGMLFQGLPEPQLAALSDIALHKSIGRNEIIFHEGDPGDGFYVVAKGKVKIYKLSLDGKEQILHIFAASSRWSPSRGL